MSAFEPVIFLLVLSTLNVARIHNIHEFLYFVDFVNFRELTHPATKDAVLLVPAITWSSRNGAKNIHLKLNTNKHRMGPPSKVKSFMTNTFQCQHLLWSTPSMINTFKGLPSKDKTFYDYQLLRSTEYFRMLLTSTKWILNESEYIIAFEKGLIL